MQKFCTNCIFCNKTSKDSTLWKCTYGAELSLVDGLPKNKYCNIERSSTEYHMCGPEGRYFEPYERF